MKIDNIHKIVLRGMTKDDIPAVERIEQTCFSDAWSEKLLSDMLESKWDEAWVLAGRRRHRHRLRQLPLPCRGR